MGELKPCPKCGSRNIGFKYKFKEQTHNDVLLNRIPYVEWYECNDCGNQGGKSSTGCSKDCINNIVAYEKCYFENSFFTNASFWWNHQGDDYIEFS